MNKKTLFITVPFALAMQFLQTSVVQAKIVDIEITNLTHAMHFTPLLVTAHSSDMSLFVSGQEASSELQAMAEGGDISGLENILSGTSASTSANPAAGLLAPTTSTMVNDLDTGDNTRLSIVGMILPTNDGFVGLDSWEIPSTPNNYTIYLNAYDAGTEANDEIVNGGGAPGNAGIPAIPGVEVATTASGVTSSELNTLIHIHRGNVGDIDTAGGISDLDSRIHRWLNPVAKVVVTVK
ncbi:MAG: hypothetical protein ACI89U_001935 [Gammaproteobacteria bacterium]|jgi:hypothetical protein